MSNDGSKPLLVERAGHVLTLTFNRPDAGNSIDLGLSQAFLDAVIEADEDDSIRCVVLTGAGKMFCAGGDVASFAGAGDKVPALLKHLTARLHIAMAHLARMNKPLVCSVNGAAAGIGLSLATLGDIVLGARASSYSFAYTAIGLTPDGGASWLLPRLIGLRRTQEMVFTNRRLTSEEAFAMGLITRVVEDAELANETAAMATKLAGSATRALGRVRNLLLSSFENGYDTQMELEARAIATSGRDAEGREGIAAFLAKRKPNFSS